MRGLQITIFILAMIALVAQTTHFVYVKYFYETASALDDYAETKIKKAESLQELVKDYESSLEKVKDYEKDKSDEDLSNIRMQQIEPYKTKLKLESAITDWESKEQNIKKLWVQWSIGLMVLAIGCVLFYKGIFWFGMALVISGIGEMIWWSSPSLNLGGAVSSFETLLNYKLALSLISLLVVAVIWSANERRLKIL
jgi:hypothetical protein